MNLFGKCFDELLGVEGKYSNRASDSGGATKYGITERVARANDYTGDMRELTEAQARAIAKSQYWDTMRLDAIGAVAPSVAREMMDTGYNMGIGVAGKYLQRALNVFNMRGEFYPDAVVDGLVGPLTISNLRAYMAKRGADGEVVLLRALNSQQGAAYINLADARPKDEDYVYGWLLNRVA